jgi:chemotaxis protein methyltransferase CheR
LRKSVRFQIHNLLEAPPHPGEFDIVLCRNVLLYLTTEKRRMAFDRIAAGLAADGWLMLGAGETVIGQTERFGADIEARGLYRRTDGSVPVEKRVGADRRAASKG